MARRGFICLDRTNINDFEDNKYHLVLPKKTIVLEGDEFAQIPQIVVNPDAETDLPPKLSNIDLLDFVK